MRLYAINKGDQNGTGSSCDSDDLSDIISDVYADDCTDPRAELRTYPGADARAVRLRFQIIPDPRRLRRRRGVGLRLAVEGPPPIIHEDAEGAQLVAQLVRSPEVAAALRPDARGQAAALLVTRPILALARRRAVGRLAGPTPLGGALLAAQVTELGLRERGRRFPLEHFRGPQHPARGGLGDA